MKRPSHREISGKLAEAKEAAAREDVALVEGAVISCDLLEMDILIDDLPDLLPRVSAELDPRHYRGWNPPQKSYVEVIKGCELYVFVWVSKALGCEMYFKFTIKGGRLWIVSFHRNRTKKEGDSQ